MDTESKQETSENGDQPKCKTSGGEIESVKLSILASVEEKPVLINNSVLLDWADRLGRALNCPDCTDKPSQEPKDNGIVPMPLEYIGNYYNACAEPCDMLAGPCACGATHTLDEWSIYKKSDTVIKSQEPAKTIKEVLACFKGPKEDDWPDKQTLNPDPPPSHPYPTGIYTKEGSCFEGPDNCNSCPDWKIESQEPIPKDNREIEPVGPGLVQSEPESQETTPKHTKYCRKSYPNLYSADIECTCKSATSEFVKELHERCNDIRAGIIVLGDRLEAATKRADAAEKKIRQAKTHIGLLNDCDDSSTRVIGEMDDEIKKLQAKLKSQQPDILPILQAADKALFEGKPAVVHSCLRQAITELKNE